MAHTAPAAGPRVVAIGGGTGLSATLRAVRRYAGGVVAVVSVADDGGSSGRLREALGVPPPGDLRKALVALGDPALPLTNALDHRFSSGDIAGHALGNLLVAGLAATTGSFAAALDEVARTVGAVGRVLPATEEGVVLKAESRDGSVEGQVAVANVGRIAAVSVVPPDVRSPREAIAAIEEADQVVLGPGSLFTSVLAAAIAPDIRAALERTSAQLVYVANVREQPPETEGFTVADHYSAVVAHGIDPDVVLYDPSALPVGDLDDVDARPADIAVEATDGWPVHDPAKLAAALGDLVG